MKKIIAITAAAMIAALGLSSCGPSSTGTQQNVSFNSNAAGINKASTAQNGNQYGKPNTTTKAS